MEPEFIDTIFTVVKAKLELVQASEQAIIADQKSKIAKRESDRRECETQLKKLKLSQAALLEQFLEGMLTKGAYQSKKAQITAAVQDAVEQLSVLDMASDNASEFAQSHRPFFGQVALTREMLQGLIKEIRVTSVDEVEIVWKFQDCYQGLQGFLL